MIWRRRSRALEYHAPLRSLGRPNDRLGAGRIETGDENWRALFGLLICHAQRVSMVPIGQPATMEEVRRIAATPDLLAKTIFVPPANRRNRDFSFAPDPAAKSIGAMRDWTRAQVADVLAEFPAFRGGARLATFPEGEAALAAPLLDRRIDFLPGPADGAAAAGRAAAATLGGADHWRTGDERAVAPDLEHARVPLPTRGASGTASQPLWVRLGRRIWLDLVAALATARGIGARGPAFHRLAIRRPAPDRRRTAAPLGRPARIASPLTATNSA
ncbi:MAG: hypothetical protein JNL35_08880 [Sphingopyxis sp.]|nr:hypothetical protein [Sphingopyxis sp.]